MNSWNPWKVTAISMFVVLAVALVTGMVVASWSGSLPGERSQAPATKPAAAPRVSGPGPASIAQAQGIVPTQAAVETCNRFAADNAPPEKTTDTGRGAALAGGVGATGGALYGMNENRKNDGRYRAAYWSCMRAKGYAG